MSKSKTAAEKKPATASAPKKAVPKTTLLRQASAGRLGLFNFYGAQECPPGAIRLDVIDVYEWYILELGPLKVAFNVGRDL